MIYKMETAKQSQINKLTIFKADMIQFTRTHIDELISRVMTQTDLLSNQFKQKKNNQ
jgi:hypothetical protein